MVPNGWNSKPLAQLLEKIIDYRGQSVPKSSSGIPLITARNVREGYLDFSNQEYVDESKFEEWMTRGIPQKGDILFTTEAPLGKACRYPSEGMYAIGQRTVTLRTNKKLDPEFLLYTILSERGQLLIDLRSSGSTAKGIKSSELKKVKIAYPESLSEQRKIAKILSTWDKAITTTEQLIAASQQQKKALMQQLLTGKKRLLNPETGKVFEGGWEEVSLSKLCSRLTEKNKGQSTNVVTISAQHGLIRQEEFFKKSVASETLDNYFILRKGQFAYNKSYSNGYPMGAIKRLNRYEDAVVTSLYICFEIKDYRHTSSCFLEQFFESGLLNRGLTKVAAEGGRAHGLLNVKPTDFMALTLHIPKFKEQQKIASVLTVADKEIELLQAKLAHLKEEKKALMQQLLTGKRRVKVDTTEAA
ncbi:restriction endonuclease subunit S [Plesiomonas shigelloides]|uniref:restriction endonuclease subunit S n=1 Tax=Plesiomonas shigelloides TaxID=703 RepID=UPI001262567C|nr:restriction endonuclease subunit S [Plesiomonas shigelloides]KAB7675659.1 restriction endonuclease subunit S [Plesiomonas shigelloides]